MLGAHQCGVSGYLAFDTDSSCVIHTVIYCDCWMSATNGRHSQPVSTPVAKNLYKPTHDSTSKDIATVQVTSRNSYKCFLEKLLSSIDLLEGLENDMPHGDETEGSKVYLNGWVTIEQS